MATTKQSKELLTLCGSTPVFGGIHGGHHVSSALCFFSVCLRRASCVSNVAIVSRLSILPFTLTFIKLKHDEHPVSSTLKHDEHPVSSTHEILIHLISFLQRNTIYFNPSMYTPTYAWIIVLQHRHHKKSTWTAMYHRNFLWFVRIKNLECQPNRYKCWSV